MKRQKEKIVNHDTCRYMVYIYVYVCVRYPSIITCLFIIYVAGCSNFYCQKYSIKVAVLHHIQARGCVQSFRKHTLTLITIPHIS